MQTEISSGGGSATFLHNLPKIELHVHLEGAIPLDVLWQLSQKYRLDANVDSLAGLKSKFRYKNFTQFIDTWIWIGKHLQEYEDYSLIASAVSEDLQGQGIRYAEIFYSPTRDSAKHLDPQRITEAIVEGFEEVSNGIKLKLIADIVRDNGPGEAMEMVERLGEMQSMGPVGIGIGGSEHLFPARTYAAVFKKAREYGLRTTAHAGEAAGSESIWEALKVLQVERIGHGIRAMEDPSLMQYLKEKQIPIELCPTANLRTGVVNSIYDHPVKAFYEMGLNIFLNSDDPKMFNTSLCNEYQIVMKAFNFNLRDVRSLTENAIASAWFDDQMKSRMKDAVRSYFDLNLPRKYQ